MQFLKIKNYVDLDVFKERYNFTDNGDVLEYDDLINHLIVEKDSRRLFIVDGDISKISLIIYNFTSKNILEKEVD